ncbi:MAG: TolC family protein [Candidatus Magnetominusculus sp. LBB02]|nr:TolC family protein [Candidatus Magnetominusculus sp. LBB02]
MSRVWTIIKKYNIAAVAVLVLVLLSASVVSAEDRVVTEGEYLTLDNCIDIALKQQPNLMYYLYQTHVSEAQEGQAKSALYPSIDLQGGFGRYQVVNRYHANAYSTIINKDDFNSSAQLTQTLFDFGKTLTNVKMRNFYLIASKKDYEGQANTTALNVKSAYYGVIKAMRARDVDNETVTKYELQLERAKDFFKAGTKARYDVTQAEVNLSGARISLMTSENALAVAWDNLTASMGIIDTASFKIDENMTAEPLGVKFEEALQSAYDNRPDLMAAVAAKDAAEASIDYAKKDYLPVISGTASYNFDDGRFPLNNGWVAGVVMKWNIFSGYNTKYKTAEARANKDAAESKIQSLRLSIFSGVKQSYLNLKLAEEVIPASELQVKLAKENLDIVTLKYESGLASPVDYTDAIVQYKAAKLSHINALYNYKIAQSAILWAMGKR